jgi:hypothetical protein
MQRFALHASLPRPWLTIVDEFDSITQNFSNVQMKDCVLVGNRDLAPVSGNTLVPRRLVHLGAEDSFMIGQQALLHGRPPSD